MKIAMVGIGVVGTLYGWALAEDNQVDHYVRREKLNKYDHLTIPVDVIDERLPEEEQSVTGKYKYHCIEKIDDSYDLVIVPVNSFQIIGVLRELKQQVPDADYLLMTLNWKGTEEIDSILRKDQYVMGYAGGGGTFKKELLWADLGADLMLGSVYEEQERLWDKVDSLFRESGIIPNRPNNILHTLWMHNIDSAPLGVGLAKYHDTHLLVKDKELVKVCFDAMKECYKICEKRGVDLKQFPEVEMYNLPFEEIYPVFKANFETNPVMKRYSAHAVKAIGEMVNNFMEIYDTGKELNVNMPNMESLYRTLKKDK